MNPQLSLVIPAFNEADRIGSTIARVCDYLEAQSYSWEVIVVIDGGDPQAASAARSAGAERSGVRVIHEPVNHGKGFSVRRGFGAATGDRLVFIDADLSLPVEGLEAMMASFDAGADVVIASRAVPGAREIGAPPPLRRVMSRGFNLIVQAVALPGLKDTQCGFKGFRAEAARRIFARQQSDRFGFDVEALFLARLEGYRIDEIPVTCTYHAGSSVNRFVDVVNMVGDVCRLRWRHRKRR